MTSPSVRISELWQKTSWVLWLGLVLALPVTSFPIFARVLHTSAVAPASGIFILMLAVFWLPFFILKKGRFPFQVKPALAFFLYAFATVGMAFLREIPDYKNASITKAALEGIATLGLGALFYTITSGMIDSEERLRKTLAMVNLGGMVMLLWSLLQVGVSFVFNDFNAPMRMIQHFFSTTVLFDRRATGFASEPSWLAHQLNLVYLTYWLSATLNRFSAHRFKIFKLTLENILLVAGFVVLFATFSRGGLIAFMLILAFLFVLANIRFARWLVRKIAAKRRVLVGLITGVGMLLLYLGIALGGLIILSKLDARMADVFKFSADNPNPLMKYADNLQFGERVVYWQTGWNIFNNHPITGVGVGFSGYYFPRYLPDYAWGLPEVRQLMAWGQGLLNIKNLWARLLAETGVIGFSLFIAFLVVIAATARALSRSENRSRRMIGWTGIFMLIAFILEEFSVDSFALPYYWFTLGLVSAASSWKGLITGSVHG